ncbi:hypothetical protein D3C83_142120 [compost metagenome]
MSKYAIRKTSGTLSPSVDVVIAGSTMPPGRVCAGIRSRLPKVNSTVGVFWW